GLLPALRVPEEDLDDVGALGRGGGDRVGRRDMRSDEHDPRLGPASSALWYPARVCGDARLLHEQGRLPQAAAAHRGPGARAAADGRCGHLLHRRPDPDLGRHQRAAERGGRPARRAPPSLRQRRRGVGGARRVREGHGGHPCDRTAREELLPTRGATSPVSTTDRRTPEDAVHVDLPITGMTCAACAARIERKLNRMGGVEATVNYVTGRASVDYDAATVSVDEVAEVVRRLGYGAEVPAEPRDRPVPVPEGDGSPHSG